MGDYRGSADIGFLFVSFSSEEMERHREAVRRCLDGSTHREYQCPPITGIVTVDPEQYRIGCEMARDFLANHPTWYR
ncbi:hypothetical protein J4460_03610 [Candidatus Woesearchaeota archaeon]|nr:MAG: hypothetical protein QS99_C0009G0029 [archaeon GW2011_AR4]MBS3129735.1 hypothetical protein [Candidatus Woesearchaeota archaeon]HIH37428.1 hypothetical protein [Candidatus Woesearchaeota archaeon]HIH48025.1 hypothetical protein [Candidatus Woesearchaeota archaeon]HIJ02883.1 hypothetical protein [Candidatus Woesearchaeota archaeon]